MIRPRRKHECAIFRLTCLVFPHEKRNHHLSLLSHRHQSASEIAFDMIRTKIRFRGHCGHKLIDLWNVKTGSLVGISNSLLCFFSSLGSNSVRWPLRRTASPRITNSPFPGQVSNNGLFNRFHCVGKTASRKARVKAFLSPKAEAYGDIE